MISHQPTHLAIDIPRLTFPIAFILLDSNMLILTLIKTLTLRLGGTFWITRHLFGQRRLSR